MCSSLNVHVTSASEIASNEGALHFHNYQYQPGKEAVDEIFF